MATHPSPSKALILRYFVQNCRGLRTRTIGRSADNLLTAAQV